MYRYQIFKHQTFIPGVSDRSTVWQKGQASSRNPIYCIQIGAWFEVTDST
jgi:hypothetical protein